MSAPTFKDFEHVIGVGGGPAVLLEAILQSASRTRSRTLFDLPVVVERARARLERDSPATLTRYAFGAGDLISLRACLAALTRTCCRVSSMIGTTRLPCSSCATAARRWMARPRCCWCTTFSGALGERSRATEGRRWLRHRLPSRPATRTHAYHARQSALGTRLLACRAPI
jgi:O-methyltransferase domain